MASLQLPIYIVDAFTNKPFSGNPAAVCLLTSELEKAVSDEQKQKIGGEMNLAETAFVTPIGNGDFKSGSKFGLRWFTPTTEVDLCGHATLATAAVIFNEMGNSSDTLEFSSRSGILKVTRNGLTMTLNFPLNPPSPREQEDVKKLLQVMVGDLSLIQDVQLSSRTRKLLVRLRDDLNRETLESFSPNTTVVVDTYNRPDIKGIGLTLKGTKDNGCINAQGEVYDFVSRYFAPWLGILEDPVTGAWHTVASAYWAKELGKNKLFARQCSKRGGDIWLELDGERVNMSGQAVINLKGTFYL